MEKPDEDLAKLVISKSEIPLPMSVLHWQHLIVLIIMIKVQRLVHQETIMRCHSFSRSSFY